MQGFLKLLVLTTSLGFVACEQQRPDVIVSVEVPAGAKSHFVATLTEVCTQFGLVRLRAPGIEGITDDGTVFYTCAYSERSSGLRPLVFHNLLSRTTFEVDIYMSDVRPLSRSGEFKAAVLKQVEKMRSNQLGG